MTHSIRRTAKAGMAALIAALITCMLWVPFASAAQDDVRIEIEASPLIPGEAGSEAVWARYVEVRSPSALTVYIRFMPLLSLNGDGLDTDYALFEGDWIAKDDGWWYLTDPIEPDGRMELETAFILDGTEGFWEDARTGDSLNLREVMTVEAIATNGLTPDWEAADPWGTLPPDATDKADSLAPDKLPRTGDGDLRRLMCLLMALAALGMSLASLAMAESAHRGKREEEDEDE